MNELETLRAQLQAANARADRAEVNCDMLTRERDNAVLTFKAQLDERFRALFADLGEAHTGERFGSVEEEILTGRLRFVRDVLAQESV